MKTWKNKIFKIAYTTNITLMFVARNLLLILAWMALIIYLNDKGLQTEVIWTFKLGLIFAASYLAHLLFKIIIDKLEDSDKK